MQFSDTNSFCNKLFHANVQCVNIYMYTVCAKYQTVSSETLAHKGSILLPAI